MAARRSLDAARVPPIYLMPRAPHLGGTADETGPRPPSVRDTHTDLSHARGGLNELGDAVREVKRSGTLSDIAVSIAGVEPCRAYSRMALADRHQRRITRVA